jgi:hypothetical protein
MSVLLDAFMLMAVGDWRYGRIPDIRCGCEPGLPLGESRHSDKRINGVSFCGAEGGTAPKADRDLGATDGPLQCSEHANVASRDIG